MRSRAPALLAGKMFEPSDDDEDDEGGMSIFDLPGMRASDDDEPAASSTAATICGQCDETAPPAWHDLFSTGAADSEADSDCDALQSPSPPAMEPLPARRKDMRGSYDRSDGNRTARARGPSGLRTCSATANRSRAAFLRRVDRVIPTCLSAARIAAAAVSRLRRTASSRRSRSSRSARRSKRRIGHT